jgi:hypothetical protein
MSFMKFFNLLFAVLLTTEANLAVGADFQSDLIAARPAFQSDEQRLVVIGKFASFAKAGDSNAMLGLFVPAARAAEGDAVVSQYFKEKIIPFFANYEKLHTYRTIEPRQMPDDSVGYRYFTYFINATGEEVPFDVIVMEVNGISYIANFNARGCIKGKHPICK